MLMSFIIKNINININHNYHVSLQLLVVTSVQLDHQSLFYVGNVVKAVLTLQTTPSGRVDSLLQHYQLTSSNHLFLTIIYQNKIIPFPCLG